MILSRRLVSLAAATTLLTATCSDGSNTTDADVDDSTDASPDVIATTSIWADIAGNVLCDGPVPALVPAGADPHTFEPSLRDRERIETARLVIANGAGLDEGLVALLDEATTLIEAADAVALIDDDPHIWQDPRRVARVATRIAAAADAADTGCLDDYIEQLDRLDREIIETMQVVPENARVMVTSHDALGYFGDRYRIEIVGTVIPSTNTLAETNAADLAALADLIEERNVQAIFTEELESSSDATALAERLGVQVVPLVTDALTDDPDTDSYLEMMRSNATRIAEALAP